MSTTARAALSEGAGRFRTVEVELDQPWPEEVLVEVRASGLCASDLHSIANLPPGRVGVAGHEFSGIVRQLGSDVRDLAPGRHVVGCLVRFCGVCSECLRGEPRLCVQPEAPLRPAGSAPRLRHQGLPVEQLWGLGGFASHVLVHRSQLHPVSVELPFENSFLLGCGVLTGVGTVLNAARVTPGSSVAVLGTGGVGLSAVQGARFAGAGVIVAVDIHRSKLDAARRAGATHTVDASRENVPERLRALTGGRGVEVAIEAAGALPSVRSAIDGTRDGGRIVLVGLHRPEAVVAVAPLADLILSQKTLIGASMGGGDPRHDIPALAALAADGLLDLGSLVSAEIGLDDIESAYRELREGIVVRSVVTRF
jgi:S-(hydroxymethyl)glutathione dehydrogenase/alcohol dehydrogenase